MWKHAFTSVRENADKRKWGTSNPPSVVGVEPTELVLSKICTSNKQQ
jgi:hypothetical protein